MSLDNITLSSIVLQNLYNKPLYETTVEKSAAEPAPIAKIDSLGTNAQRICILVYDENAIFLQEDQLQFLIGILTACSLSMADIALVNVARQPGINYKDLGAQFEAEKVFMFGLSPQSIELPLAFPDYQVQSYNNQVYLSAPQLSALQTDKAEKLKLWNCLKSIFSI